jgi:hypothetical protein
MTMFNKYPTQPGSDWIFSTRGACGSVSRGGVQWIYNQYHDCCSDPRRWLCTPILEIAAEPMFLNSLECVIDDFGDMVAVKLNH